LLKHYNRGAGRRAASGALTGFFQSSLAMASQLLLAPVILSCSGQEVMGAYAILMQIVGYSLLLDFGFSVALTRFLAQATDSSAEASRFAGLFREGRRILWLINLLIGVFLLAFTFQVGHALKVQEPVLAQAQWALSILSLWMVLRTPLIIYNSAMLAAQEMATQNLIGIGTNLFRMLGGLALVLLGSGLVGLVIANLFADALGFLIQRRIFLQRHGHLLIPIHSLATHYWKELFSFGLSYWGVNLSVVLLLGSDNLIAGTLYGAAAASVFYTTKMIGSLSITLVSRMIDSVFSGASRLAATGNVVLMRQVYLRLLRYVLWLLIPIVGGILLFTQGLVSLWVGPAHYGGDRMAAGVAFFVLTQVLCHLHGTLCLALGRIESWGLVAVASGLGGVSLAFVLGKHLGMPWIPVGFGLANLAILALLTSRIYRCLGICQEHLRQMAAPLVFGLLLILAGFTGKALLGGSPIQNLGLAFFYGLVALVAAWFWGLRASEKAQLFRWMNFSQLA